MYLHSFIDEDDEAARPTPPGTRPPALPSHYDETSIMLLVRDPSWIMLSWEVSSAVLERLHNEPQSRLAVRIHQEPRPGTRTPPQLVVDADLTPERAFYLQLGRPDEILYAVLGIRDAAGVFAPLARSAAVQTPRDTFADLEDTAPLVVSESLKPALLPLSDLIMLVGDLEPLLDAPAGEVPVVQFVRERQVLHDLAHEWDEQNADAAPPVTSPGAAS